MPALGNYERREPMSVVLLDNASTHNSDKVVQLIESTGAMIQYTAPFSPDLNPIENFFALYKKNLKRNSDDMLLDWEGVHDQALKLSVNREHGIKYFRRCGIKCAENVMTEDEEETYIEAMAITIIIILILRRRRRIRRLKRRRVG